VNDPIRALLNKNRAIAKAAAEASVKAGAEAIALENAPENIPETAQESAQESAREAAVQAASLPSPSTAKSVEGFEGGSNGGTPPLPAAFRRETEGVAGESKGATGNPVVPKAAKTSKQSGKTVQMRMRFLREYAEMLMQFKPENRAAVVLLVLDGRIGSVWNLEKLANAADQLRRVGVLLNQALRHMGRSGKDIDRLVASVHLAMREIKKLRPLNYEEGVPEITDGKTLGKITEKTPLENPATNPSSECSQATENADGNTDGKAGEA